MKRQLTLIPTISIHPDRINFYQSIHWSPSAPTRKKSTNFVNAQAVIEKMNEEEKQEKYKKLLTATRTANGIISKTAKKKLTKALDYLLIMANNKKVYLNYSGSSFNFKIAFITVSLSSKQIHSDNKIKEKLLNQLLIELRKVYKVRNYIWRAEKQKNGNIHFHIIVDKFIPHVELRNRWNRIQNKLGYVDRYQESLKQWHANGFKIRKDLLHKWSKDKQYSAWLAGKKTDFHNPNSTDIHSVRKIHNIKLYISKYLTKNEKEILEKPKEEIEKLLIEGRIWGCNYELNNLKGAVIQVDNDIEEQLKAIEKSGKAKIISDTFYQVIFISIYDLQEITNDRLFKAFALYLLQHFNYSEQLQT